MKILDVLCYTSMKCYEDDNPLRDMNQSLIGILNPYGLYHLQVSLESSIKKNLTFKKVVVEN